MAEVRKNKKNEKYDIDELTDKKVESNKKEEKKNTKTTTKKKDSKQKKSFKDKWKTFWHGVSNELKMVHWPTKETMIKYSIITILFIIFLAIFFYIIDIIFAFVQSLI